MWMTLLLLAQGSFATLAESSLACIEGRAELSGLRDSVEVIRDRWGVPHIYARSTHDLFFAQGYVQAQDRLWQMDMYRRIWTGELARVLGPDYLAHDRLARLLRYRGPWDDREWRSYHPEGRRIFEAFAAGVNAFIEQAGANLPVEFRLTGLTPGRWSAELSLLRTQTAVPLGDARAELNLARNVAQFGVEEANRRARPSPHRDLVVPDGFDPALVTQSVVDALGGLRQGQQQLGAERPAHRQRQGPAGQRPAPQRVQSVHPLSPPLRRAGPTGTAACRCRAMGATNGTASATICPGNSTRHAAGLRPPTTTSIHRVTIRRSSSRPDPRPLATTGSCRCSARATGSP